MVSSARRKVRRYLLGATQKATRIWWIGQVSVREMSVSRLPTSRTVREKADHGAEKSRQTRRRRRGLRIGRVDRGMREPWNFRQPPTKSQSVRKVNHMDRKIMWASLASRKLRKDCEKYNKFPRGPIENPVLSRARLASKLHCEAKWHRLHSHALECGLSYIESFYSTFREFLLTETSRVPADVVSYSVNPSSGSVIPYPIDKGGPEDPARFIGAPRPATIKRRGRGGVMVERTLKRACRACGYVGSGPHDFGSCRRGPNMSRSTGVPHRRGDRGTRRRCGCLRGAKCPH